MSDNAYFRVQKPVYAFKHVGSSNSNTWIGSSRVINTVQEGVYLPAGADLHALVGGLYCVVDGVKHRCALQVAAPILEAKYHRPEPAAQYLRKLEALGVVQSIEPSDLKPVTTVHDLMQHRYPDFTEVLRKEHSDEYSRLHETYAPQRFGEDLIDAGNLKFRFVDYGMDRKASAKITFGKGGRLEHFMYEFTDFDRVIFDTETSASKAIADRIRTNVKTTFTHFSDWFSVDLPKSFRSEMPKLTEWVQDALQDEYIPSTMSPGR